MNPIIELAAMISDYVELTRQRGKAEIWVSEGWLAPETLEIADKGLKCVREEIEKRMEDILKVDDEE